MLAGRNTTYVVSVHTSGAYQWSANPEVLGRFCSLHLVMGLCLSVTRTGDEELASTFEALQAEGLTVLNPDQVLPTSQILASIATPK